MGKLQREDGKKERSIKRKKKKKRGEIAWNYHQRDTFYVISFYVLTYFFSFHE